jgi:hypothetical protein
MFLTAPFLKESLQLPEHKGLKHKIRSDPGFVFALSLIKGYTSANSVFNPNSQNAHK